MTAQEFYQPFTLLCLAYNRELTDALAEVYFMVLEDLTAQQFQSAIKEVLATRKYTNLPMPADILEAVHGNSDERAIIALKQAEDAVSRFGMYKSVIFQDKALQATIEGFFTNGWIDFCKQCGGDEWKFQKIEFVKLYKAYLKQDKKPKGDYLVGWCQHQNEISAIETEPENVYLVGYQQAPYCLPAPIVKELIRKQTPQIELTMNVVKMVNVKKIHEVINGN